MVLIHFPAALTDEEETLKLAYARLKKKKKIVQSLKAAAQNPEKEASHGKATGKQAPAPSMASAGKATEHAKKLVQSGAIKVAELKERSGFKRSKNFEKKLKDTDKPTPSVGFQPFSPSLTDDDEEKQQPASKRVKGLSESFVSAGFKNRGEYSRERGDRERDRGDRERDREKGYSDRPEREHREPPKRGNTVYVHGAGITEGDLKQSFSNFGNIVNITMEPDRNNAFITFDTMDAADHAIQEANQSKVNNTLLSVQMARRQPTFESHGEGGSSSSWGSIAASTSQKGATHNHKEKRALFVYDQDDIF